MNIEYEYIDKHVEVVFDMWRRGSCDMVLLCGSGYNHGTGDGLTTMVSPAQSSSIIYQAASSA